MITSTESVSCYNWIQATIPRWSNTIGPKVRYVSLYATPGRNLACLQYGGKRWPWPSNDQRRTAWTTLVIFNRPPLLISCARKSHNCRVLSRSTRRARSRLIVRVTRCSISRGSEHGRLGLRPEGPIDRTRKVQGRSFHDEKNARPPIADEKCANVDSIIRVIPRFVCRQIKILGANKHLAKWRIF